MAEYMSEIQARKAICAVGDKMYDKGFVAANDGNISVKISEDTIIVTPTGVSKGGMTTDILVKMRLDGTVVGGSRPSSEVKMHIMVYRLNPGVKAVVHAHPPASTAFAAARIPMDRPILSESILTLGVVPVADYALPGTHEVPDSIVPYVTNYNAVLLANHGLLTWGADITQAMYRMESAEHYAKIMVYLRQIGEPKEFNCGEVDELISIRKRLGIEAGGVPPCTVSSAGEGPEASGKSVTEQGQTASGYSKDQIEKIVQEAVRRTISEG